MLFAGGLTRVMSVPEGSIHAVVPRFNPYGSVTALPVTGSMDETEPTLPAPSTSCEATGTAWLVMGSFGAEPLPSQPRLIVPVGARSTPPC